MGRYRKIDPRIWTDEKFMSLKDQSKLMFLYVLTHPNMTAVGAMRATIEGLAAELRWKVSEARQAIGHAMSLGMIVANNSCGYIELPNFLKYNEPEGPNSVSKAWIEALYWIPECREKRRLISKCRKYLDAKSDGFKHAMPDGIWDAFSDGKSDPSPIHEQEQEQEQEQDRREGAENAPHPQQSQRSPNRKAKATTTPEKFEVGPELKEWASKHVPGLDVEAETDNFLDGHRAKGNVFKDWNAAWRKWMRNEFNWRKARNQPPDVTRDGFATVRKRLEAEHEQA
jgi:hypothetical protein